MFNSGNIIRRAVDLLDKASGQSRKDLSDWYFPTSMEVKGVKSEDIKSTIKIIKSELKRAGDDQVIRLCKEMALTGIFEVQQVAFGILNKNFRIIGQLDFNDILALGTYMDNWVSTDSFGTQVSGPAWRLKRIDDDVITGWAQSTDRWWRRIALVSTVGLNLKSQKGEGDTERTLLICRMLVNDRDDMVVKAMSWALRELSKRNQADVSSFLDIHQDELAGRVLRETRRKLLTGRKN